VISSPLIDEVKGKINQDSFFAPIITLLLKESKNPRELRIVQGYKLENDCLYLNDRLCIPREDEIRKKLLVESHDSPIAGHPGYINTYMSIKKSLFWPGLKGDMMHHVWQCLHWEGKEIHKSVPS